MTTLTDLAAMQRSKRISSQEIYEVKPPLDLTPTTFRTFAMEINRVLLDIAMRLARLEGVLKGLTLTVGASSIAFENGPSILWGTSDPRLVPGLKAPVGSIYLQAGKLSTSQGAIYLKFSTPATGWRYILNG